MVLRWRVGEFLRISREVKEGQGCMVERGLSGSKA